MEIYVGLVVLCVLGLIGFLMTKVNADAKRVWEIVFFCTFLALCFDAGGILRHLR